MLRPVQKIDVSYRFYLVLILFSMVSIGLAQENFYRIPSDLPLFQYDLINVHSNLPDNSRFNLFIEIAYDELQFIKTDSGYLAEYEVTVAINDPDGEQVAGKNWSEKILIKDDYERTNSREERSITDANFHVPPGKYGFIISLMDKDTKKVRTLKMSVVAKDFKKQPLEVSDITMVSYLTIDSLGIKSIRPLIAHDIHEDLKLINAYYEIYSREEVRCFTVKYKILNFKRKEIISTNLEVPKTGNRTMTYFPIEIATIPAGKYQLILEVNAGKETVTVAKIFVLRWRDLPATILDLDTAIEQLRYIANNVELKSLRKAHADKKLELFQSFWVKRDPTPGTTMNEHMEEYYRRISYANDFFSGFREGWKSDMGMVFIIFGEPNDVERHPFESGSKPYQIWYYYEINRNFVFIDETGFGDYRLASGSWDEFYRDTRWRP